MRDRAASNRDLFCPKPFEHFELSYDGCYVCCPGWLPKPVGRFPGPNPLAAWNGEQAQSIRRSILDGSFRYCTCCPFLTSGKDPLVRRDRVTNERHLAIIREGRVVMDRVSRLHLTYDRTCNLSCPSCRTRRLSAHGAQLNQLRAFHASVVTPELLRTLDCLYMTGSGDPFASPIFGRLLRTLDAADFPRLRLELHTNGLLLDPKTWEKMKAAQPLVDMIEISIDAADPKTYAENRRGGNWERLQSNLAFVAKLRRDDRFRHLRLSFVVQSNNWREMGRFFRLAHSHAADSIQFTALRNWGTFSTEEYSSRAVHLPAHPENGLFMAQLQTTPELRDPRVVIEDFHRYVRDEQVLAPHCCQRRRLRSAHGRQEAAEQPHHARADERRD